MVFSWKKLRSWLSLSEVLGKQWARASCAVSRLESCWLRVCAGGKEGRRLEEVMSHPQNFIQTLALICRATWLLHSFSQVPDWDQIVPQKPQPCSVSTSFCRLCEVDLVSHHILCGRESLWLCAPQMERSWQFQDWWDTVVSRSGTEAWWLWPETQLVNCCKDKLQREMAGWGCIPANNL